MHRFIIITSSLWLFLFILSGRPLAGYFENEWLLPVGKENRETWNKAGLTSIGLFGKIRQARPGIPEHLHTGVDFTRPGDNYTNEPVYPAADGTVISIRDDGPYAQIIIVHTQGEKQLWTVYEHISGIQVELGETVSVLEPIARFMNTEELNNYGWQFDHLHFEIMKVMPKPVQPDPEKPDRFFDTFGLECYDRENLLKRYFDPKEFFETQWHLLDINILKKYSHP
ncbi:M23 family metallopeptidase [candidate division KSB1 bacterium]